MVASPPLSPQLLPNWLPLDHQSEELDHVSLQALCGADLYPNWIGLGGPAIVFHKVKRDGAGLTSGVWLCRLPAGGYLQTRKMILAR